MSHRNARLTPRGRQVLVQRVRDQGMPVAHVAKAMGISRQCAHRWVRRFDEEGLSGLEDRSSRPNRSPRRTDPRSERRVLAARRKHRCGPAQLARLSGVPERTVTRVLRLAGVPRLAECDPMTSEVIRASRETALRYERARPGELVHVDVKKLGRIPPGGGWRARGELTSNHRSGRHRVGYDYVHSMVDDHSRFAYSEVLGDELGQTCAAFLRRAAAAFADAGIVSVAEVMTDNAENYPAASPSALAELGAAHVLIRPHCPGRTGRWRDSTAHSRSNGPIAVVYRSNAERTRALALWLRRYNSERPHSSLGGRPPVSRLSRT